MTVDQMQCSGVADDGKTSSMWWVRSTHKNGLNSDIDAGVVVYSTGIRPAVTVNLK